MSNVPEGHPGDLAWRLPVWRTLLKLQLVKPEQLEPANAKARDGGFFLSHLVALGVNPDKLLTSVAIATGLPSAPRHEVRRPKSELGVGLDPAMLRALLASPFRKDPDLLHLAFVVPLPKEKLAGLPPHKAYVALESDIRDGLETLFPADKGKKAPEPEFDPFLADLPPPPSAPPAGAAPPPSKKSDRGPSAEELKAAGLIETHTHGRDELLNSIARLKWVGAAILGLLVLVKAASWVVESSRNEAEKKGAELRQGMANASIEAAKAQQRAMQPGGGGVKDAPLPVPTPVGNTAPRAGSLDEVTTAIANLDVAARRPDGRAFAQDCFKLADALRAYAPFANSVRQIGPLNAVATQTMMLCERETVGAPPLNEWLDLRQRIQNALKGDP